MLTANFRAREIPFFQRVDQSAGAAGCHPWTGAKTNTGLGILTIDGQQCDVRDVAFAFWHDAPNTSMPTPKIVPYGEKPPTPWHAVTTCGNSLCCHPRHLRAHVGKRPDTRGARRKLDTRQVALCQPDVRELSLAGLAFVFGVAYPTVQAAARHTGAYANDTFDTTPHFSRDEQTRIDEFAQQKLQRRSDGVMGSVKYHAEQRRVDAFALWLKRQEWTHTSIGKLQGCHADTVADRIRRATERPTDSRHAFSWATESADVVEHATAIRGGVPPVDPTTTNSESPEPKPGAFAGKKRSRFARGG